MKKRGKTHIVIPDTQVKPNVNTDHLEWCGNYIAEKRPDVIIQLGDFADMESLCAYDEGKKSFENRRYRKDVLASHKALKRLVTPWATIRGYKPRKIMLLGNHEDRINRAVEIEARLEGVLDTSHLGYESHGFEVVPFLKPKKVDGIVYCHYFPSGPRDRPICTAKALISKYHTSCVAGHQQGRDIAFGRYPDGRQIIGLICGSFYQHEEGYMSPLTNKHWRGFYMLHEVVKGSCEEMAVTLNYLKRKYS